MEQIFLRMKKILRISAPLLFTLLVLAALNALPEEANEAPTFTAIPLPGTTTPLAMVTAVLPTLPAPTATPIPTSTPIPTATLPPEAAIRLLGPPDGSLFRSSDTLTFYWQWPVFLENEQYFQLSFYAAGEEVAVGSVAEPNLGSQFRLHAAAAPLADVATTGHWQVHLLSPSGQILRSSELRSIRFLEP